MCGRFSFVINKEALKKALPLVKIEGELQASYNIAPTQQAYVVTGHEPNLLQPMYWGLVPSWSKEGKPNGTLINARMETIIEKPSFRNSFRHERCIVPADSFYEWRNDAGRKIPFRILPTQRDMLFLAGVHSVWKNTLKTFSIITTSPNAEMAHIHNRMPVVLNSKDAYTAWLSNDTSEETLLHLCQQPEDGLLQMYRISEKINSVRYNSPDLHQTVPDDLTLF